MKWKNIKPAFRSLFPVTISEKPQTHKSWKETNGFVRQGDCCDLCSHNYRHQPGTSVVYKCKLGGFVTSGRNWCKKYQE